MFGWVFRWNAPLLAGLECQRVFACSDFVSKLQSNHNDNWIWGTLAFDGLPKNVKAFNSQSCFKHKNWLLSSDTTLSLPLSPSLPLSSTVHACSHCGDFMALNQTQRLHYGSIRRNKHTLSPIPSLPRRALPLPPPTLPPPLHIHTFTHISEAKSHIFHSVTSYIRYWSWGRGENADKTGIRKRGRRGTEVGRCVCAIISAVIRSCRLVPPPSFEAFSSGLPKMHLGGIQEGAEE